jgi:hypothetical protein
MGIDPQLSVFKRRRLAKREVELRRIEQVKNSNVVPAKAERSDRVEYRVRLLVQIRHQDQQASAPEVLGHLVERRT